MLWCNDRLVKENSGVSAVKKICTRACGGMVNSGVSPVKKICTRACGGTETFKKEQFFCSNFKEFVRACVTRVSGIIEFACKRVVYMGW